MRRKQTSVRTTSQSATLQLTKGRSIDSYKLNDRDYRDAIIYGLIRMLDEPDLISEERRHGLEALLNKD